MRKLHRIASDQSGFALPMALLLLMLGGFLVATSSNLVATSLKSNIVTEERTRGFHAADAGIEDAVWHYQTGQDPFAGGSSYVIGENINGMTVTVEQFEAPEAGVDGTVYTVKSTARLNGEIKGEVIAELVGGADFTWLFDAAITSPNDVTIKPGCEITGDIVYGGDITNQGDVDGDIINDPVDNWPTAEELSAWYWSQVESLTPVADGYTINVSGYPEANPRSIGPLSGAGSVTITGTGWGRLDGLVYIKGNFVMMPNCGLELNNQTIFCEGNITIQPNSYIKGTGCIIAIGNIIFQPNMVGASEDDFLFLMSIDGTTEIKPNGDIFGSIAGDSEVELFPNNTLTWTAAPEGEGGLNFPGSGETGGGSTDLVVRTYTIN